MLKNALPLSASPMRPAGKPRLQGVPSERGGRYARFSSTRQGRTRVFEAQRALFGQDSGGSHRMARHFLESTEEESRVDAFLALLAHPEEGTRKWVVAQLRKSRELLDLGKVGFVVSHLRRPEPELRVTAAEALSVSASPEDAGRILLEFVKAEERPQVVSRAIELLGELRRAKFVKPALERMRRDPKYRLHWELLDIVLDRTLTGIPLPPEEIYLRTLREALERAKRKEAGRKAQGEGGSGEGNSEGQARMVLKCPSGACSATEEYKKRIRQQ